jgi:PhoD-like phosphatase
MGALEPDFFLCSGDTVCADGPLSATVALPGGRTWRNVVTEAKSKVAESLDDFRGQFAYNLLDENLRAFAAHVPQLNQWDDHEVHNNWYPGQILTDVRYTERSADVLAARSRQAFFEWLPIAPRQGDDEGRIYRRISHGPLLDLFLLDMRTYKDPNDDNRYADPQRGLLVCAQRAWLKSELPPRARRGRCSRSTSRSDLTIAVRSGALPVRAASSGVRPARSGNHSMAPCRISSSTSASGPRSAARCSALRGSAPPSSSRSASARSPASTAASKAPDTGADTTSHPSPERNAVSRHPEAVRSRESMPQPLLGKGTTKRPLRHGERSPSQSPGATPELDDDRASGLRARALLLPRGPALRTFSIAAEFSPIAPANPRPRRDRAAPVPCPGADAPMLIGTSFGTSRDVGSRTAAAATATSRARRSSNPGSRS